MLIWFDVTGYHFCNSLFLIIIHIQNRFPIQGWLLFTILIKNKYQRKQIFFKTTSTKTWTWIKIFVSYSWIRLYYLFHFIYITVLKLFCQTSHWINWTYSLSKHSIWKKLSNFRGSFSNINDFSIKSFYTFTKQLF